MAKGRKLTTSRSERYLGSLDYNHGRGAAEAAAYAAPELMEDDVWSVVDGASYGEWTPRASAPSDAIARHPPPRADVQPGGLSLAFDDSGSGASQRIVHQYGSGSPRGRHVAGSAPVNVPDWSRIYRVDSAESFLPGWDDDGSNGDSEVVPPHEYLARSRNVAANSVFEGAGRTLKGRDLSRVRDAVWSRTGFDG